MPPRAMVGSWPLLPLGAMSRSVTMQRQGSVTHITAREPGKSLVRAAAEDHMDVQGLCRKGLTLTGCDDLESWSHFLPGQYLGEQALHPPHLGSRIELGC